MVENRKIYSIEQLVEFFKSEFGFVEKYFQVQKLLTKDSPDAPEKAVNTPGIYVHWRADLSVIKVGKSQTNSKKRALEHIRDNTRNEHFQMGTLENDPNAWLVLFNVEDPNKKHWLLSLEAYLDKAAEPLIPSGRIG